MPISRRYSDPRPADRSRRQFLAVAVGLLVAAMACQLWPAFSFWRQSRFATGLAAYAEGAADGAARLTVRRVAECGLPGVDSLVRLAGSPQAVAATAAREALLNELAAWEMEYRVGGDFKLFSKRLRTLSDSLAERVGHFDPEARQWSGTLAQQIVAHGDDVAALAALDLLRSCETVLALAPPVRRAVDMTAPLPGAARESAIAEASPGGRPPLAAGLNGNGAAGDGAPSPAPLMVAEPLRVAQAPTADLDVVPGAPAPAQPLLTTPTFPAPRELSKWPTDGDANPLRGPGAPTAPSEDEALRLPAPPLSNEVVDVPSPAEARHRMRRYRQLSDSELAALLGAGSSYESLAVRQVLRERGKAEATTTARRPGSVTDASREKVLETISRLPAAEGRAMLRRLVVDADPEVRLQALTILATTDDPQLATIVRRRAVEDADPRVTELASRILKERK